MTTSGLLPGAEPASFSGGRAGVLCLHGFSGNPTSMRGVATVLAEAGFTVELPLLPGHGTSVEDMQRTGWPEWSQAADEAYLKLAAGVDAVVVAGLSMGGALTAWLGARYPEIAGLVCINPVVQPQPDEVLDMIRGMIDEGEIALPSSGSDIADPDVIDAGYGATPLPPFLSLMGGLHELMPALDRITAPLLVMTSPQDHVVDPVNSDVLAAAVRGPVERVTLERSYHVATRDYDRGLIEERTVAFCRRVLGDPASGAVR